ncbi:hypothetical protein HPB47_008196, partial [Ixodes persulcatus]
SAPLIAAIAMDTSQLSEIQLYMSRYSDSMGLVPYADAPVCRGGQKQAYGVARDETAKVSCELDADPADVVFQWRFNNSFEERHLAAMSLDEGLRSVASYIPRSRADYGSLLCWGKNSVGVQLKPCVFSIQAAGPPEPLSNCNVLNATADSLQIACDSGYDGGLEQTFHLERGARHLALLSSVVCRSTFSLSAAASRGDLPGFVSLEEAMPRLKI